MLLSRLFRSSLTILKRLVNDQMLDAFKLLIKRCGPESRLINLFTSICFVEGRPVRAFQVRNVPFSLGVRSCALASYECVMTFVGRLVPLAVRSAGPFMRPNNRVAMLR